MRPMTSLAADAARLAVPFPVSASERAAARTAPATALRRSTRMLLFGLALALVAPAGASAEPEEDCPTWLPDFRCEREGRWEGWVAPVTMPYYFEDPFITTDIQAVGIWHAFPGRSVFQGGDAGVVAVQARLALTDRLAFIASQDGYLILRPGNPLVHETEGFMDLMAGLKYALIEDEERGFILTPSLRFQLPFGTDRIFQGQGSGAFVLGTSFGWTPQDQLGPDLSRLHVIGQVGFSIPLEFDDNTSFMHWNLHFDYAVSRFFVPFIGFNGITYMSNGDGENRLDVRGVGRLPLDTVQDVVGTGGFEGFDVANLGSDDVKGDRIVTLALGARFPIAKRWSIGAAYERAISRRKDIFGERVTLSTHFTY